MAAPVGQAAQLADGLVGEAKTADAVDVEPASVKVQFPRDRLVPGHGLVAPPWFEAAENPPFRVMVGSVPSTTSRPGPNLGALRTDEIIAAYPKPAV